MSTLLLKDADVVVAMDPLGTTIPGGGIYIRDNIIEQVGPTQDLPEVADEIIDATGLALVPGLINTHHHFFQSLFRAIPGAQDCGLFDWLRRLVPLYSEVDAEAIRIASLTAMAELLLSGCTTTSDHQYIFSNNTTLDTQIESASVIGLRLHATRGSMSLGESDGGLVGDNLVEDEDVVMADCVRLIERYHDPSPLAMVRIGLAPCTPFVVTKELMRESAALARTYPNVTLHTHVAETRDEIDYCHRRFGQRPARYMEEVGWLGPDVWWAHAVHMNDAELAMLAETGTGIAHCPSSNMRLGSGVCRVRDMLDAGVNVGIGVDGSASNDTGHLLAEARAAVLLQRVRHGAQSLGVEAGLRLATVGGASVLGRLNELGSLEAGKAADVIGIDLHTVAMAGGAVHDPVAALLLCSVDRVDLSIINGRQVIRDGRLLTIDVEALVSKHNDIARKLVSRHSGRS